MESDEEYRKRVAKVIQNLRPAFPHVDKMVLAICALKKLGWSDEKVRLVVEDALRVVGEEAARRQ